MAEAVGLLASVVQLISATTKTYRYLHDVKDAPKERSQLGLELAQLLPTLEEFRCRIENADPNDPVTKDCLRLGTADGPLKNTIVAIESLRDRIKAGKGISGLSKRFVWTLGKREVQDAIRRIERFKALLSLALQNESIRLSQAIKADTNSMPILVKQVDKLHDRMNIDETISQAIKADTNNMPILLKQVDKLHDRMNIDETIREDRDDDAQRKRVAEWLSSLDLGNCHRSALNNRTGNTGQWFLETQEFQDWIAEPRATLYCPGIPGAGKTIIAAIAIVDLQEIHRNKNVLVLYVYCYHKEESLQTLENLARGFLKQILQQSHTIPDAVLKLHYRYTMTDRRPSVTELTSALVSILSSSERSFLVVDALDEYSQIEHKRNAFLDVLSIIKEHCNIMLTSRPAITVSDRFPKARHLEIRARETDVRRYVKSQIPMLAKCVRLKAELQKLIEDTIAEAVEGMFLLARLYVQSLTDKLDPRKIKAALATFPKGSGLAAYNAAYDETLNRITTQAPGFRDMALKVISWITLAQRSLTIRELEHALAVEPQDEDFDTDNVQDMETITSVCAGLVIIDGETGTARFVHYTAQEYFRGGSHEFLVHANTLLASTCITYLLFKGVLADSRWLRYKRSGELPDNPWTEVPYDYYEYPDNHYTLLEYVSQFWSFHTRRSNSSDTSQHALRLLNDKEHLMNALAINWNFDRQVIRPWYLLEPGSRLKPVSQSINELTCSRLCTAATLGLSKVVEVLIAQGVDANQEKVEHQLTALHYAVAGEHEDIAALLLEAGADPNLSSREGSIRDPLSIAAGLGSESIVKLLVDKGADTLLKNEMGYTPLNIAISKGHLSIAKLLVQKSPDSVDLRSPLCGAALHGQMPIVAWLLELGADVHATERHLHGPSACHYAVRNDHADVAKLLIEHDADLDRPFKWNLEETALLQTLLQKTAKKGNLSMVELILSYGAHPDYSAGKPNVDTRSPLWYACALSYSTFDVSDKNSYLPIADSRRQRCLVARALLAHGADVNTSDDGGVTPLHLAAFAGHAAMVQLLLEYRALVNQKDRSGRTALYLAISRKSALSLDPIEVTRIIEILLDHGAEYTEMPTENALEENALEENALEEHVQHDEQIVELSN